MIPSLSFEMVPRLKQAYWEYVLVQMKQPAVSERLDLEVHSWLLQVNRPGMQKPLSVLSTYVVKLGLNPFILQYCWLPQWSVASTSI
jgi:hypothetical protein